MDGAGEDRKYWLALQELVAAHKHDRVVDFDDLLDVTEGAFPCDVLAVARTAGLNIRFSTRSGNWQDRKPDPSPAQSEYYFTSEAAARIADAVEGRVLCLGTPAIAEALGRIGREVALVDSGQWVRDRFDLQRAGITHAEGLTVEEFEDDRMYDSAVLDPPWYFPALTDWLTIASANVVEGGTIWIPLLPALTRPSAVRDTEKIMRLAGTIGNPRMTDVVAEYESPVFERRAMERCGGRVSRPWRRARMLQITNLRRPVSSTRSLSRRSEWTDFRIGDSVISVRTGVGCAASDVVQAVKWEEFLPSSVCALDTVSHRDPRVRSLNVWSSESTGLTVRDPAALAEAFSAPEWTAQHREKLSSLLEQLEIPK